MFAYLARANHVHFMAQSKEMKAAIKRLKALQDGIYEEIQDAFDKKQVEVIEYNTNKQLFKKGERSDGARLIPKYAESTKRIKRKKGQRISNVTLRDTGDFYKSIKVDAREEEVEIKTDGSLNYSDHLENRYGALIYGLQPKFLRQFYNRFIKKRVKRLVKNAVK